MDQRPLSFKILCIFPSQYLLAVSNGSCELRIKINDTSTKRNPRHQEQKQSLTRTDSNFEAFTLPFHQSAPLIVPFTLITQKLLMKTLAQSREGQERDRRRQPQTHKDRHRQRHTVTTDECVMLIIRRGRLCCVIVTPASCNPGGAHSIFLLLCVASPSCLATREDASRVGGSKQFLASSEHAHTQRVWGARLLSTAAHPLPSVGLLVYGSKLAGVRTPDCTPRLFHLLQHCPSILASTTCASALSTSFLPCSRVGQRLGA